MKKTLLLSTTLSTLLLSVSARTDLDGCTSSATTDQWHEASMIWWVPGTGEICAFPDCGGGRAPPKHDDPACPGYTGTASYEPSYMPGYGPGQTGGATATATATATPSETGSKTSSGTGETGTSETGGTTGTGTGTTGEPSSTKGSTTKVTGTPGSSSVASTTKSASSSDTSKTESESQTGTSAAGSQETSIPDNSGAGYTVSMGVILAVLGAVLVL